jgi:hypothetical protein
MASWCNGLATFTGKVLLTQPKIILFVLAGVFVFTSCSAREGTIVVSTDPYPLTIQVTAPGKIQWIWFEGPFQNIRDPGPRIEPLSDPKKIILWQIAPSGGSFIDADSVPPISYGVLPPNWVQEIPDGSSSPPPLLNGYVYYIQAVPVRGGGARTCIFLKDGKALPYQEDTLDSACGRKQ